VETDFVGLFYVTVVGYVACYKDIGVLVVGDLKGWFDFYGVGLGVVEGGGKGLNDFSSWSSACCDELNVRFYRV
jgi:hypothetical protein